MEKFANLPPPIKWVLGVTGISALVGTGAVIMAGLWMFILILVLLLAILLGGYFLWTLWRRKQRSAALGGELAQHSSASPRGISDPGQRARLDDLRKKFETGVREYKARGKDLYKLPWYAIVGEPGSGKTEAIRHSNVGFPPGMQDEFQGVGGTINMNWWFTNQAVLLDTAGRLMFDEVRPGETSEWKEFLTLLKKNRPNCPINGLMLVIPSDSLIKDSADDIQRKAGKIAQQLDVIQRVLDVRFPVFVIVTKCDKVNGFREFFDGVSDPQLQHQMMGWSNPAPLDDPFRPDMVDKHLDQVVQRLRRRRSGLLKDPVPENANGRRTDEVDSLYALPHSLSLIAPRLRRYLETIFVAGEWSSKPLFLRGIYFSSSMREGSALDAELAEAIGMPVEELPEGKVWERERAYFLRDLFIEKAFRERGLVTRATNTARMLRTQMIVLCSSIAAAFILFLFFAWFGTRNLQDTVKRQSDVWVNATNWWPNKTSKQSIIPQDADGIYTGAAVSQVDYSGRKISVGDFHSRLREQATNEMRANWFMPGLAGNYNRDSKKAQRIVFEGSVIKPLVEAARKKMERAFNEKQARERGQAEAFDVLFQLEGDLLTRNKGANKGEVDIAAARRFISALYTYVTGQDPSQDPNFKSVVEMMVWTYSVNEEGRGKWPPAGLSDAVGAGNTLDNNASIRIALELYLQNAVTVAQDQVKQWGVIGEIAKILGNVKEAEPLLFTAAKTGQDKDIFINITRLKTLKDDLDKNLAAASTSRFFEGGVSLTNAYAKFTDLAGGGELRRLRDVADRYRQLCSTKDQVLFNQVIDKLRVVESGMKEKMREKMQDAAPGGDKSFAVLDRTCLVGTNFIERGGFYQEASRLAELQTFKGGGLVGDKGDKWIKFTDGELRSLLKRAAEYTGVFQADFTETAAKLHGWIERRQRGVFFDAYMAEADKKLGEPLGFPLARSSTTNMTAEKFMQVEKELTRIDGDIRSAAMPKVNPGDNRNWTDFTNRASLLFNVCRAILGEKNQLGSCVISLMKMDKSSPEDAWRIDGNWRNIRLLDIPGAVSPRTDETTFDAAISPDGLTVDKKLSLELVQRADSPGSKVSPYDAGEWGAIALLHKFKASRKLVEPPATWSVSWPLRSTDGPGGIRLKLKFDRAFPDLESWPER